MEKLLVPGSYEASVFDLADYTKEIFAWPSAVMNGVTETVVGSDLAVFASPTYKASYTGLLKAFLDPYPANGLSGLVAIPVLTSANQTHSMGVNVNFSPLLVELGAVVPGAGFYFMTSHMDRAEELVTAATDGYVLQLRRLANVAQFTSAPAPVAS